MLPPSNGQHSCSLCSNTCFTPAVHKVACGGYSISFAHLYMLIVRYLMSLHEQCPTALLADQRFMSGVFNCSVLWLAPIEKGRMSASVLKTFFRQRDFQLSQAIFTVCSRVTYSLLSWCCSGVTESVQIIISFSSTRRVWWRAGCISFGSMEQQASGACQGVRVWAVLTQ